MRHLACSCSVLMASSPANTQAELSKQTPQLGSWGYAHYKGPLGHLFIARYACFVQYGHKIGALRGRVVPKWYFGYKKGGFCGQSISK